MMSKQPAEAQMGEKEAVQPLEAECDDLDNKDSVDYVLIIHDVEDYGRWKEVFNAASSIRRDAGEIDYKLLHEQSDERKIVHFSRWHSLKKARLFFESGKLADIRRLAGVKAPQFLYLQRIEQGAL